MKYTMKGFGMVKHRARAIEGRPTSESECSRCTTSHRMGTSSYLTLRVVGCWDPAQPRVHSSMGIIASIVSRWTMVQEHRFWVVGR